jgi:hypothetical protein
MADCQLQRKIADLSGICTGLVSVADRWQSQAQTTKSSEIDEVHQQEDYPASKEYPTSSVFFKNPKVPGYGGR